MADIKHGPGERGEQQGQDIQQRAIDMLEQQKGQLASWLDDVAQSVRQAGQSLREQEQDAPGRYSEQAADRIEQVAVYVRRKPVQQIRQDAEAYAREHPAIVLGSAVVVGMLAGRFLRSSSPAQDRPATRAATGPATGPATTPDTPAATIEPGEPPTASRGGIES